MRAKEGPNIWEVELEPQVPSLYLQPCGGGMNTLGSGLRDA